MTYATYPALVAAFLAVSVQADEIGNLRNDPGRAIAEAIAAQVDADSDGFIDLAELDAAAEEAMAAIDRNDDGRMTRGELMSWQMGMAELAAFRDRAASYETVMAFVFDIFDRDNDSIVSPEEHRAAVLRSYDYADLDEDGRLTIEEYLGGFIFNVAMRSATVEPELRPK